MATTTDEQARDQLISEQRVEDSCPAVRWSVQARAWAQQVPSLSSEAMQFLAPPVVVSAHLGGQQSIDIEVTLDESAPQVSPDLEAAVEWPRAVRSDLVVRSELWRATGNSKFLGIGVRGNPPPASGDRPARSRPAWTSAGRHRAAR